MNTRRDALISIKITSVPSTNTGLWIDRYFDGDDDSQSRSNLVKDASKITIPELYAVFYQRWKNTLAEMGAMIRTAKVKGRMIVGLGNESVLETSVTLHRTYGVPYIPGSAIKGLAASYARRRLTNWHTNSDAYKVVFGDTDDAGYITFFDALYVPETDHNKQPLYPDVITVHHQKYYQDASRPPADWDDPNPVPFVSATGSYLIALAAPELDNRQPWLEAVFDMLKLALLEMGIGAKTSSGYGRLTFEDEEESIDFNDPEIQAAEALSAEIAAIPDQNPAGKLNPKYFSRWGQLQSTRAKTQVARAIVDRVNQASPDIRQRISGQGWFKAIQGYLAKK